MLCSSIKACCIASKTCIVCAGHDGGCEVAVHAMRMIFNEVSAEGVLLVGATNAINCINRQAALHIVNILVYFAHHLHKSSTISSKADYAWQW